MLTPSQESQDKQTLNADNIMSHSVEGSESDSGKDDESALDANRILDDLDDDEVQKLAEKVNGANLNNDDAEPGAKMAKGSYTDAVKSTQRKVSENFLLYVQSSEDQRLPLPRKDWEKISQLITNRIMENFICGGPPLEANWLGFTQSPTSWSRGGVHRT